MTLKGRYGQLEKLGPEHAADLWAAFAGHDEVWTYISTDGPFAAKDEFFSFIDKRAAAEAEHLALAMAATSGCASAVSWR